MVHSVVLVNSQQWIMTDLLDTVTAALSYVQTTGSHIVYH